MIEYNKLTFEEYKMLLNDVGWKLPSERLVKISLEKGINVKYVLDSKTVGMASFVTNGGYAGLIMDVVVLKKYRGKGYGTILIESILNYIKKNLENDEEMMIQLLSAPGKQDFYSKFGFKVKKEIAEDGMYMWLRKE